jgi:hypothetical protein
MANLVQGFGPSITFTTVRSWYTLTPLKSRQYSVSLRGTFLSLMTDDGLHFMGLAACILFR